MQQISFLCAFAVCVLLCGMLLPLLKKLKAGQEILEYVTEHSSKRGTPTMGGIAFIITITLLSAIFCNWSNRATAVTVAVFFAYGVVGFLDDFIKIRYKRNMGLHAYQKIIVQLAIAVLVSIFVRGEVSIGDKLRIPFTDITVNIGFWIIPLVIFIYLACTNSVNLTDGIDGLATSTTICFLAGMIALLNREKRLLDAMGDTLAYRQTNDIVTLCYISIGALAAFLLFNSNDAKVFMGDTGSLALGAMVACVAIFTRMSLFIPIVGLMFVVSSVSVIMQVVYFKATKGKRIFLMAPFHHHLQKKHWSETRICVLYSVITVCITFVLMCFGE